MDLEAKIANKPFFLIHLFFTFFLFLILPNIEFSANVNIPALAFLILSFLNFILTIVFVIVEGQIFLPYRRAVFVFFLFLLYMVVHYLFGPKNDDGRIFAVQMLMILFLVASVSQVIRTPKIALLFLCGFVANGVLQIIRGINQKFIVYPELLNSANQALLREYVVAGTEDKMLERINEGLAFGTFIYPNAYATWLTLFIFAVLYLWKFAPIFQLSRWIQILLVSFIVGALYGVWIAGAKGVLIAILVTAVFAIRIWFLRRNHKEIPARVIYRELSFLSIVLAIGTLSFSDKILSLKVRLQYWYAGWQMFWKEPHKIFGLGNSNFGNYYPLYKLPEAEEVQKAHSVWVSSLTEQGVVGLSLVGLFVFFLFADILRRSSSSSAIDEKNDFSTIKLSQNTYLFLFYFLFLGFVLLNPNISQISASLSLFTPIAMMTMFCLIVARLIYYKNVFKCLSIEQNMLFQIYFLAWLLLVYFMDVFNAILKIEDWPNFDLLNESWSIFVISCILLLFFVFTKKISQVHSASKNVMGTSFLSLLMMIFFLLMISADMIFEYPVVTISFLLLLIIDRSLNEQYNIIVLPSIKEVAFVAGVGFVFLLFSFQYFILPEISITRYQYLYEYWIQKKDVVREGKSDAISLVLDVAEEKFPDVYYFHYQKALFYQRIGLKYKKSKDSSMVQLWYEKAIDEIRECLRIIPQKANLLDFIADLKDDLGDDIHSILKIREEARALYPQKPYYLKKMGDTYRKLHQNDLAIKYYQKCLELNKNVHRYVRLDEEDSREIQNYLVEFNKKSDMNSTLK